MSGIVASPALDEANPDGMRIKRTVEDLTMTLSQPFVKIRLGVVKYLNTVTGQHFDHGEWICTWASGCRITAAASTSGGKTRCLQRRRIDEDGRFRSVVHPHSVFPTMIQQDA